MKGGQIVRVAVLVAGEQYGCSVQQVIADSYIGVKKKRYLTFYHLEGPNVSPGLRM